MNYRQREGEVGVSRPLRVLIVEDSEDDALLMVRELERGGYECVFERAETAQAMTAALAKQTWDVVLADYSMPHFSAPEALALLQKSGLDLPFIVVSGGIGEDTAVATMKAGAHDYLMKGNLKRLVPAVERELHEAEIRKERKQAEERIKHAAEEWRTTFDSITDLVFIADKDFRLIRMNKAFADACKMKPLELIGKPCYEVVHGTKKPWPNCPHKLTLETKKPAMAEFLEPQLGIYLQISTSPIFDEEGEVASSVHIMKDITERKEAEKTLQESEERFRAIFDNATDGILVADMEKKKFYTGNKMICQMLGYSLEEIKNLGVMDIHPKEDLPYIIEQFEKQSRGEFTLAKDIPVKRKDGSVFYVEINSSFLTLAGETYQAGIFRDITERKRMEEQFIITDRLASIGEMAAGIAHELNNPLTGVIGLSQLLAERDLPEDVKEDLKLVYSEAQRAAGVVKNMLTFAREHPPAKELLSINDVISEVLKLRAYEQRVSNIEVVKHLAPDLPQTMGDYFQLQQVFLNIVINAEQIMTEVHGKGTLMITTQTTGDIVTASFADDGPGIPEESLGHGHIFDPFFTTKEVGKGTGLGLSICHGIISAHGGQIYAESKPGKGATLIVELPLSQEKQ